MPPEHFYGSNFGLTYFQRISTACNVKYKIDPASLLVGIRELINQIIRILVQEILMRNYGMAKFFLCGLSGNASNATSFCSLQILPAFPAAKPQR